MSFGGYYEVPKVFILLIGSFILSIYWIVVFLKHQAIFKISTSDSIFFLWILILLVSSVISGDVVSIIGGGNRYQGVLFFLSIWLLGKTAGSFNEAEKGKIGKFVAWSLIAQGILVISQVVSGKTYFGRPLGTLGEVNAVSGMLAVGSYFVYKYLPNILLTVTFASVFLTMSKSGILSLLFWLGGTLFSVNKKIAKVFLPLLLLSTVAFVYIGINPKYPSVFENRLTIWKIAFSESLKKPLLGYGAEMSAKVFDIAHKNMGMPLQDFQIDRAHNLFLDITIWSGYIGLSVFALFLLSTFKNITYEKRYALVAFLVFSFFQPLSLMHWVMFMLFLNV